VVISRKGVPQYVTICHKNKAYITGR